MDGMRINGYGRGSMYYYQPNDIHGIKYESLFDGLDKDTNDITTHCTGIMTASNKEKYIQTWKDRNLIYMFKSPEPPATWIGDLPNGILTIRNTNQSVNFTIGMNMKIIRDYRNVYFSEYLKDNMHGYGMQLYDDGIYVGHFKDDKPDGNGV
jgi:hypothetical protein